MTRTPSTQQGMSWAVGAGIAQQDGQKVAKAKEGKKTGFNSTSAGGTVFTGSVLSVKMTNFQL